MTVLVDVAAIIRRERAALKKLLTRRVCGCGATLAGKRTNAAYASAACRARAWKARTGYRRGNAGNGTQGARQRREAA